MKSLVLAFLFLHAFFVKGQDRVFDEEKTKVLREHLQSFKNIYNAITDGVFNGLLKFFESLEYDASPNIPLIRRSCINIVDEFIYSEKGVNKDIVKFLELLNVKSFTKIQLSRIVDLIQQMASLQAKIICLTIN